MIDEDSKNPDKWKSIIQVGLDDYTRDETRNKAIMDPDEIMRTYKIDLPNEVELVEALGHNMIVYVDKRLKKIGSYEFDGIKDAVQKTVNLENANEVVFIEAVLPGVLAVSYKTK